ncbi:hypothetical protein AACT_2772 [Arcobacter acticola]|uniref:Uncharacterized protein n=1 Tax=Arcobacter acticola TaxID=1849015 RepID=A0A6M8EP16_9BACT|nr:hypothetical protein AACT_2772 [Arcobacter acticola]
MLKKSLILFVLLVGSLYGGNATANQEKLLINIIRASNYSCEGIESAFQSSYDGNWLVICTNDTSYDVNKTEQFWEVKKRR